MRKENRYVGFRLQQYSTDNDQLCLDASVSSATNATLRNVDYPLDDVLQL